MAYQSATAEELIRECNETVGHPTRTIPSRNYNQTSTPRHRIKLSSCSPRILFIKSKPAVLILLWTIVVGGIYSLTHFGLIAAIVSTPGVSLPHPLLWTTIIAYMFISLMRMFYPIGGLVGDVRWGRFRTVTVGLVVILVSVITAIIYEALFYKFSLDRDDKTVGTVATFVAILSFGLLILGFSAFNSNVVQLGLDQLMDEPSECLGVFVHWFVWSTRLGPVLIQLLFASIQCTYAKPSLSTALKYVIFSLPIFLLLLLIFFLVLSCCTHKHFNKDKVKYNPYKVILKVLNFARKNKYPVGPTTAFAYCDDTRRSRIDFAKDRYGGPFTTANVEDVKSFFRVFLVLLALGPTFVLNLSSSYFSFLMFSLHTGQEAFSDNGTCGWRWMLLDSGTLSSFTEVVIIPIYIWIFYCVLRNRIPKILTRLGLAVFLYILAVFSMFAIDLAGHIVLYAEQKPNVMCMFVEDKSKPFKMLNVHWSVLIFPNVLKNISQDLIMATAFEFISAQSPHTMKGVLVGTLYAFGGLFEFFGALLLPPFAVGQIWEQGYLGDYPPVTSCGFGYYLTIIVVALIGLCVLIIAVKKYKYRKRDEEPFSQAQVEEIFSRRVQYNQPLLMANSTE